VNQLNFENIYLKTVQICFKI